MTTTLLGPYPDAPSLTDHWWWRPGWQVGTRFYAWHLTVEEQPELRHLVQQYQEALRPLGGFTLIPEQWLHITCQGIGHVADVDRDDMDAIVDAARDRLAALAPAALTFHRPVLHGEAVVVPPTDPAPLIAVRDAIRDAIAQVWGEQRVTEAPTYHPHVSVAYSSAVQEAAPVRAALNTVETSPVEVTLRQASLIVMHRDHRMYEWTTAATAPISS